MNHTIKRTAYLFLYIPTLFVPKPSNVVFADKKRIDDMSMGLAVSINVIGLALIFGILFLVVLAVS